MPLRLEKDEVVEWQFTNKARISSILALLFVCVELVVEVVSCSLLGESQVGGEVDDAVAHSLLLLV